MIGNGYWAVGITVVHAYAGGGDSGWGATVEYLDDGFCDDDADMGRVSTQGVLSTRYRLREGREADALTTVIDVIKADAERLGIAWRENSCVFYRGDGEDSEYPPPEGWREAIDAQSARLGWRQIYVRTGN